MKTGGQTYHALFFFEREHVSIKMKDAPLLGTDIVLFTDDDFELRTIRVSDWEYNWYSDGILVLSHTPKPNTIPIEHAKEPTDIERLRADVDFIAIMTGVTL